METWDPIGVAEIPEAHDEYDPYLSRIHAMLTDGKSTDAHIRSYLSAIESEWMGFGSADDARITAVIAALRALDLKAPPQKD